MTEWILIVGSLISFISALFVWVIFRKVDSSKTYRTELMLMPLEIAMVLLILFSGNFITYLIWSLI